MPDNIQTIASDKMRLEMTVDESAFFIKTPGEKEVPIVTSQTNPLTGKVELSAGGSAISVSGAGKSATGWTSWGPPSNGQQNAGFNFRTLQLNKAAPKSFYAVRLAFRNHSLTNALPLTAGIAASPTLGNNGSALNYTAVTFGGAASTTIPVAVSYAGRTEPSVVYSDTMYIASVARTDSGKTQPILSLRMVHDASNCVHYINQDTALQSYIDSQDEAAGGFHASTGDNTTGTGKTISVSSSGTILVPCVEIQFLTGGNVMPLRFFGDSLTADQNFQNYILKEIRALDTQNVVMSSIYGIGGDKREATAGAIRNVLGSAPDWAKTGIAVVWNYSVNGTGTGYSQMAVLADDITYLVAKGLKVAVLTMHGGSLGNNAPPQDVYSAMWGDAVTFIDIASVLEENGAGNITASYTSDGTHLTAAGYAAIAPLIAQKVLAMR